MTDTPLASKTILCAITLMLAGCSDSYTHRVKEVDTDSTRYYLGSGYIIREFHLNDGTRCVTTVEGALDCDFVSQRVEL